MPTVIVVLAAGFCQGLAVLGRIKIGVRTGYVDPTVVGTDVMPTHLDWLERKLLGKSDEQKPFSTNCRHIIMLAAKNPNI